MTYRLRNLNNKRRVREFTLLGFHGETSGSPDENGEYSTVKVYKAVSHIVRDRIRKDPETNYQTNKTVHIDRIREFTIREDILGRYYEAVN